MRWTGKTSGRATVPDVRAMPQTSDCGHHHYSGHHDDHDGNRDDDGVQMEDVAVVDLLGDLRPWHAEQAGELPAARG